MLWEWEPDLFHPSAVSANPGSLRIEKEILGRKIQRSVLLYEHIQTKVASLLYKRSQNSVLLSILKWEKVTFSGVWTGIFDREAGFWGLISVIVT